LCDSSQGLPTSGRTERVGAEGAGYRCRDRLGDGDEDFLIAMEEMMAAIEVEG
jgi:hypothetical protein